jgi:hypothetical protein
MTTPDRKRLSHLGALIRAGKATTAQEAEYDRLDAVYTAELDERQRLVPPICTVWDLPIARTMYEADRGDHLGQGGC